MVTELIVISIGNFIASFVNAAFATGGVYILLSSSSFVLPLTAAVPLQSAFAFSSLLGRIILFWKEIRWSIVVAFMLGSAIGVFLGTRIFVQLNDSLIGILLGCVLLTLIWFPKVNWRIPLKHPFFPVGIVHSFVGTLFGVGGFLQPLLLRTDLLKAQLTGTLAACLLSMDIFKIAGYISIGFRYQDYWLHIALATVAGFVGTYVGKRVTHLVSEVTFRRVFRVLISVVAVRMLLLGLWGIF